MNTKVKFVALATLFSALIAPVLAEGFVRPSLLFISPTMEGASTTTGVSCAVGGRLGAQLEHEWSVEGAFAKWDESANYAGYSVSGDLRYKVLLANYRYYFGNGDAPARFYVGPSAGFACTTAGVHAIGDNWNVAVSDSTWSATWAASAGVTIRLAPRVDLDVGYRYLFVKGNDVTVSGTTVTLDDAKAHILYAGVSFRF